MPLVVHSALGACGEGNALGDKLALSEAEKAFDPQQVYGDAPNPTLL